MGNKLQFCKMHGGGNDFVVIDAVHSPPAALNFRRIADRRRGIGCDQILLIETADGGGGDFRYRIVNADGGEVGQCGNGARCVHAYLRRHKKDGGKMRLRLKTTHSTITTEDADGGKVRAYLAVPKFAPADIPLRNRPQQDFYFFEGRKFAALSLGNPHAVFFADENADARWLENAPVQEFGEMLNASPDFPHGVNVGFYRRGDNNELRVRVYERGVGETPSCGSGAVAAAVAAIRMGGNNPQVVDSAGGRLLCGWDGDGGEAWLEGEVAFVFDGEWEEK